MLRIRFINMRRRHHTFQFSPFTFHFLSSTTEFIVRRAHTHYQARDRISCQKGAHTLPSARSNFLSEGRAHITKRETQFLVRRARTHYQARDRISCQSGVAVALTREMADGTYLAYFPFAILTEASLMRRYHKKLLKTHLINKSLSLRLMTTEVYIKLHWVLVTTLLKKLIAELIGNLLREDTLLLEI